MRRLAPLFLVPLLLVSSPLSAQAQEAAAEAEAAEEPLPPPPPPPKAKSLEDLLALVRQGFRQERDEDAARIERFQRDKAEQESLLAKAKATLAREEARSQRLEAKFQEGETNLAELEETLAERLGTLGELFGVVRQISGDAASQTIGSLTSAELDGRHDFLEELGKSKELPSIEKLERLWYELAREMTEQGKVVRFPGTVLTNEGNQVEKDVVRAGVFTAVADGQYLMWDESIQKLRELPRQPPARYLSTVPTFEGASGGLAALAVDPSRGTLLRVLIETRSLIERVPDGGWIGYAIISVGAATALLALVLWLRLVVIGRKVVSQESREKADKGNPLGRVLHIYESNEDADPETLEMRLDEAVMHESSGLERLIWLVKVVSVLAPLGGLLGTVTGMIRTFQAITLFGAGDPKMMASGISEALVTTMLGLMTAIPLVLLHALLASSAKRITDTLDEQSAGLVARRMESRSA